MGIFFLFGMCMISRLILMKYYKLINKYLSYHFFLDFYYLK